MAQYAQDKKARIGEEFVLCNPAIEQAIATLAMAIPNQTFSSNGCKSGNEIIHFVLLVKYVLYREIITN